MIIIKKIMIDNCLIEVKCMMSGNQLKIIFEDNKYEMIDMNMLNNVNSFINNSFFKLQNLKLLYLTIVPLNV